MAHYTGNTAAFIEAEQYSQFILTNLPDGILPDGFFRDVSDFGSGTNLHIKSIGSAVLQDVEENIPMTYNPIDTGTVTLTISDYVGDAWYITDNLREDGAQVESLSAARAQEATRALQEDFETKFLKKAGAANGEDGAQAAGTNTINSFQHRYCADGGSTNNVMELADLSYMGLAFDKANVPMAGRVGIVDPVVGTVIGNLATSNPNQNEPQWQAILENGFAMNHKFVMNIFGWDIWTSNRLHVATADEAAILARDGSASNQASNSGNVNNVFMCILDDNTKPIMGAWRRKPKAEGERNVKLKRDEFDVTSRFGFGAQRLDTLGVILTHPTALA